MNSASNVEVLRVAGPAELNATNAGPFRDRVRTSLQPEHRRLDLEFSGTWFVDSSGLGALISLHKLMISRGGQLRVIDPSPPVLQLLELTRMHRIFEIVKPGT